jgi:beta-fructofuranosidase
MGIERQWLLVIGLLLVIASHANGQNIAKPDHGERLDGESVTSQLSPAEFVAQDEARPAGGATSAATIRWLDDPPEDWLTYHLVHPDTNDRFFPGDPNAAIYYAGRYHLHYLYWAEPDKLGLAHVSSTDMVHWKWHPTVLTPSVLGHEMMLSGTAFLTKEGKPAIIYSDNRSIQIIFALDDSLDLWTKPRKVEVKSADGSDHATGVWDPDCWLIGDTYYAIGSGGKQIDLMKSKDLRNWQYVGRLMHDQFPNHLGVTPHDDISCPNMFRIGDQWMLLCISHSLGCRYFLGGFKDEQYLPVSHELMNWQNVNFGDRGLGFYFAPESLLTPDGRRVMWAWLFPDKGNVKQGTQSLPRELKLDANGYLKIKPLRELESLRYDEKQITNALVKNLEPYELPEMSGDAVEFRVTFQALAETYELNTAPDLHVPRSFGMEVLCDESGNQGVRIAINPSQQTLTVGNVAAPFDLAIDEEAELRVFIDKNLVEVFANARQAIAYADVTTRKHVRHRLVTDQGNILAKHVVAWKMRAASKE